MLQYIFIILCEYQYFQDTILKKVIPSENSKVYEIPNEVTATEDGEIDDYVFQNLRYEEFTVKFNQGNQIEKIGNYTFYYCLYLKEINLSLCKHLTTIGSEAFSYCTSLSTLILPPNLTTIYKSFRFIAIKSIHFPKSFVEILEFYPFYKCYNLTEVTFDEDSEIQQLIYGFLGFTAIQTFTIPKNLYDINGQTFQMTNISEFKIEKGNTHFAVHNKSLYSSDFKTLYVYIKTTIDYSFPSELNKIYVLAFSNNYGELIIPNHVNEFMGSAFYEFKGTTIIIQSSKFELTESMFYNANNLKEFFIPEGVVSIPSGCFSQCKSLNSLYLPYSLKTIDKYAFNLTKVNCFLGNYEEFKNVLNEIGQTTKNCKILANEKTCKGKKFDITIKLFCFIALI